MCFNPRNLFDKTDILTLLPTTVPGKARAFVVGTYQLSIGAGGLVINLVCTGTSHLNDNRAWRIPLGLFYIVPSIILSLIFFVPESPRWLLRQNRVDDAKQSLRRLRIGAFTEGEIDIEFSELQISLEREVEQGRFVEIFRGVNLKRTGIVAACNFFQQATGQAFASQYGAVYMRSLKTLNVFALTPGIAVINIVVVFTVMLLSDSVGRRSVTPILRKQCLVHHTNETDNPSNIVPS